MTAETIFAKASGAGRAGVAVHRVSGPDAAAIAIAVLGEAPAPRRAVYGAFRAADGAAIDFGLALFFPAPASFTGEDVLELHAHGSAAVDLDLAAALRTAGARDAAPGEFTRRALANGKMDLAQVEGLADLIDAETSAQRRQALGLVTGRLSRRTAGWRRAVIDALARLEAAIDFPDEEGVPADVALAAAAPLKTLSKSWAEFEADAVAAQAVRNGVRVALVGAPNAGKSSIFNRLLDDERAIVSPTPGTTRDSIEARLSLNGRLALLVDTAGLRDGGDAIEAEGRARARKVADGADIRLLVVDAGAHPPGDGGYGVPRETLSGLQSQDLIVFNKSDLLPGAPDPSKMPGPSSAAAVCVSAATGDGMPAMIATLAERVGRIGGEGEEALARARHAAAIKSARLRVDAAIARLSGDGGASSPELVAEDLRLAARAVGRIIGDVDVEDVLDDIFSSFCVGK